MKKLVTIPLLTLLLCGCNEAIDETNTVADETEQTVQTASTDTPVSLPDTTPRVTGIGGIFFFSDDPEQTREWYAENLGLAVNQWGSSFEFRNANRPDEINYLQWSPFPQGSEYFAPSEKPFMINYRVQNIEALVDQLKENGVVIVDSIETYDYGKFVHIMDHEGNKLELWEPVDQVFTEMGGETTK